MRISEARYRSSDRSDNNHLYYSYRLLFKGINKTGINLKTGRLTTPPEKAVKNDTSWDNELTDRSVTCLKEWFKQRSNRPKYDDSSHVWLTRESNPYNSHTLNPLLRNLMDEGGIQPNDRKLSWHSIRHSTGSYLYNQHKDLAIVAEILRQNT